MKKDKRFEHILQQIAKGMSSEDEDNYINMDLVGQTIGHFFIEEFIGVGGMGVVYKARDIRLDRTVALKLLSQSGNQDDERMQLFLREAKSAATINHQNVSVVHYVSEPGEQAFIAMEYVDGKSIREIIGKNGIGWNKALLYAQQIAAGLSRAHQENIIHRDLKPDNIMINESGTIKILDFGLAKRVSSDVVTKKTIISDLPDSQYNSAATVRGTPLYMSPEQRNRKNVDFRTDVYSFGLTIFELATGNVPGHNSELNAKRETIPFVIRRCLAFDPTKRFASAIELEKALEQQLSNSRTNFSKKTYAYFLFLIVISFLFLYLFYAAKTVDDEPRKHVEKVETDQNFFARFRKLTFLQGDVTLSSPVISNDGKTIAYIDNQSLRLFSIKEKRPIVLDTKPKLVAYFADYFPNDKELLLTASRVGEKTPGIWIVNASSGIGRPLEPLFSAFVGRDKPRGFVSPKGDYIAIVQPKSISLYNIAKSTLETLLTLDNDKGDTFRLFLSWSSDGKYLAYSLFQNEYILKVIEVKTKSIRRVDSGALGESGVVGFTWSTENNLFYMKKTTSGHQFMLHAANVLLEDLTPKILRINNLPKGYFSDLTFDSSTSKISLLSLHDSTNIYTGKIGNDLSLVAGMKRLRRATTAATASDWTTDGVNLLGAYDIGSGSTYESICGFISPETGVPVPISHNGYHCHYASNSPSGQGTLFLLQSKHEPNTNMILRTPDGKIKSIYKLPVSKNINTGEYIPSWEMKCAASGTICVLLNKKDKCYQFYKFMFYAKQLSRIEFPKFKHDNRWAISQDGRILVVTETSTKRFFLLNLITGVNTIVQGPSNYHLQYPVWLNRKSRLYLFFSAIDVNSTHPYKLLSCSYNSKTSHCNEIWSSRNSWIWRPVISNEGSRIAFTAFDYGNDLAIIELLQKS